MAYDGSFLRRQRETKELSLEAAEIATHIRRHYLAALENGNIDALPSLANARGFLRLYAGYLGLDSEASVAAWEGKAPPPITNEPAESGAVAEASNVLFENYVQADVSPASEPSAGEKSGPLEQAPPAIVPLASPTGWQAILVDIGRQLRAQREKLGLSLDDVEKHTRIRGFYLQSLEAGALEKLPSTVQCRGMLNNYSHFLDLDTDSLLNQFADALQARRLDRLPEINKRIERQQTIRTQEPPEPQAVVRRFITPDLVFGAVVLVILITFVVWTISHLSANSTTAGKPSATVPSVSDVLLATDSPSLAAPAVANSTLSAEADVEPQEISEEPPAGSVEITPMFTDAVISQSTPMPTDAAAPGTIGLINNDPIQLYIIAGQRTFLRVTIDGQIKFNGRLVPGNAYPFTGSRQIDLIIGNAAAVRVYYNQQEIGGLGALGENIRISFDAQGASTPTPMPTLTPSPTPLISETPTQDAPVASPTITPFIP